MSVFQTIKNTVRSGVADLRDSFVTRGAAGVIQDIESAKIRGIATVATRRGRQKIRGAAVTAVEESIKEGANVVKSIAGPVAGGRKGASKRTGIGGSITFGADAQAKMVAWIAGAIALVAIAFGISMAVGGRRRRR